MYLGANTNNGRDTAHATSHLRNKDEADRTRETKAASYTEEQLVTEAQAADAPSLADVLREKEESGRPSAEQVERWKSKPSSLLNTPGRFYCA